MCFTAEQFFSSEAAVVLEELTQGQMLQARVVGHAEDGIPFVEIFQLLRSHQVCCIIHGGAFLVPI